jgi:hypothetical protein
MTSRLLLPLLFAASLCGSALAPAANTPIPLGALANRELTDDVEGDGKGGWSDQGKDNCLAGFPRGDITLANIPFAIPKTGPVALFLKGEKMPAMPPKVVIPANGASGKCLYLLSTYVWGAKDKVAKVIVTHRGGATQEVELMMGQHLSGWWSPQEVGKAILAWKGQNGRGVAIGVYLTPIDLKNPGKPIESVTLLAAKNEGMLAVLGLTVGDKPAADVLPKPILPQSWQSDISSWFPMELKYDNNAPSAWDEAMAWPAPAGAEGWLKADGEDLVFEKTGRKVRFKGATLCGDAFYPSKTMAPHYVQRLKKFGYNQLRFHSLMDVFLGQIANDPAVSKTTVIDEKKLDRFDNFFAELKKAGFYVKASMVFSHRWGPEAGIEQWDKIPALNNTQYFYDEKHQELYLDFLRRFFAHKNPYTGLTYAEDPAFSMFKVFNECSIFFNTSDAVPPYYKIKLQDKWNAWLRAKYKTDNTIFSAWKVEGEAAAVDLRTENLAQGTYALRGIGDLANCSAKDVKRAADQTRFYLELEQAWYDRVEREIRKLGSKVMVQGSSWGGPGHLQELQTAANAKYDFVGKHTYWLHPQGGWTPKVVTFANEPVTRHPGDNLLMFLYQRPSGKPFACTEWNFCWPNDYTVEAAAFMAAYGALQNLNANHRFVIGEVDYPGFLNNIFSMFGNPATMAVEPFAYFMYVRGDVKTAPLIYRQALDDNALHDPLRKRDNKIEESENRFYMKFGGLDVPSDTAFVGKVELAFDPKKYPAVWDEAAYRRSHDVAGKTLTSLTQELVWNYGDGWITVDTAKSKGVMGFFADREHVLGALTLKLNSAYGVAYASSLDNQPLDASKRILLGLVTRTRNTGQIYNRLGKDFSLGNQGDAPIRMEPATADLTLHTAQSTWQLIPLNANGNPMPEKAVDVQAKDGSIHCLLDNKAAGTWMFLLEAR